VGPDGDSVAVGAVVSLAARVVGALRPEVGGAGVLAAADWCGVPGGTPNRVALRIYRPWELPTFGDRLLGLALGIDAGPLHAGRVTARCRRRCRRSPTRAHRHRFRRPHVRPVSGIGVGVEQVDDEVRSEAGISAATVPAVTNFRIGVAAHFQPARQAVDLRPDGHSLPWCRPTVAPPSGSMYLRTHYELLAPPVLTLISTAAVRQARCSTERRRLRPVPGMPCSCEGTTRDGGAPRPSGDPWSRRLWAWW
jgi:hypothetical protein